VQQHQAMQMFLEPDDDRVDIRDHLYPYASPKGVSSEPVSESKFPASWENTGNFIDLGLGDALTVAKNVIQSVPYGPIPYAS
jgi:hypothetical protein